MSYACSDIETVSCIPLGAPPARMSATLDELAAILGAPETANAACADVVFRVRRLKPGETLCRAGDAFEALYAVRSGFLKIVSVDTTGNEQVMAFPMRGDVVGLGSFEAGRYPADAVALDVCDVVAISFDRIIDLGHRIHGIERLMYTVFGRELVRRQDMIRLLGMLGAEARVATFLLDLSKRYGQLGCSRSVLVLRMTRKELGSYLGITLETVSRTLSAFAAAGLIAVDRREVTLLDAAGLRDILDPAGEREVRRWVRESAAEASRTLPVVPGQLGGPPSLAAA
jgi:CRP/FNR family transcriptional regulator, anaerobic regulatory protein